MFTCHMKESQMQILQSDLSLSTLQSLLHFIYTGKVPQLSLVDAIDIVLVSSERFMFELRDIGEKMLIDIVNESNVIELLSLSYTVI